MAGVAGAQPLEDTAHKRSWALWVQPLSPLMVTLQMAMLDGTFIMLPLGVNVPLGPTQDLVLELTPMFTSFSKEGCEEVCGSRALSVSLGIAKSLNPRTPGRGFFLQPKVVGVVARDSRNVGAPAPFDKDSWSGVGGQLSLGLDVGYRLPFEHFFLSFVVGGSVGYGWNAPEQSQSIFYSLFGPPTRQRKDKLLWDPNLNLIRIGAEF